MTDRLDDLFGFHQRALQVREYRQQVLASNIANADTPNYKARDIDFNAALESALANGGKVASAHAMLSATAPNHLAGRASASALGDTPLLYRRPVQPSVDGNTVDMDTERAQFLDNAIRYEASLTLLNSQIKAMLAAIQA